MGVNQNRAKNIIVYFLFILIFKSEASENIALKKTATQSSTANTGFLANALNAVDGNTNQDIDKGSCAHTDYKEKQTEAWWQVNLTMLSEIVQVKIYYRVDEGVGTRRLNGYKIFISNESNTWKNLTPCYSDQEHGDPPVISKVECHGNGKYLTIFNKEFDSADAKYGPILVLCEVEVFGCVNGKYGSKCKNNCPMNCNEDRCNPDTGGCLKGCKKGWIGKMCTDKCTNNSFGTNCTEVCRCRIGGCDFIDGTCDSSGCKAGYKGSACNKACEGNSFGPDCKHTCHCLQGSCSDKVNGICDQTGCQDGWLGNKCSIACERDSFGPDCIYTCNCLRGSCSDKVQGVCDQTGCQDGWLGSNCSIGCSNNTFGFNCSRACNCLQGSCHHVTGQCDVPGCTSGWEGASCSQRISERDDIGGGKVSSIIIPVIVVIAVLVVPGFAVLIFKRCKGSGEDTEKRCNQSESLSPEIHATPMNSNQTEKSSQKQIHIDMNEIPDNGNTNAIKMTSIKEPIKEISITDDEYENVDEQYKRDESTFIKVSDLEYVIKQYKADKTFEKQYQKLPIGLRYHSDIGKLPINKNKNRYRTTFPYDHSRVVLNILAKEPASDYINANYIDGIEEKSMYIATQGPKKNTVEDFWRMVWQVKCGKIVMLTNLSEGDKAKCHKYWPDVSKVISVDNFVITLETEKDNLYFATRSFKLKEKKTGEIREIHQFHFTAWPDHGTPDCLMLTLFHRQFMSTPSEQSGPPVVHCSAGIGRTGFFIGLDALHRYGTQNGRINVFDYAHIMRRGRMNMIQTVEQYIVLHEALLEALYFQNTSMSKEDFTKLMTENNDERIGKEFKILSERRPYYDADTEYSGAKEDMNISKNRNQSILPVNKFRPFLMSQESSRSNYINAVLVSSYKERVGYLVTQYPLPDTVVDLWCMVYDHDSSTIVSLDCDLDSKENVEWFPNDIDEVRMGNFSVTKTEGPTIVGDTQETDLILKYQGNSRLVKLFQFSTWKITETVPSSCNGILKLIEMVENWKASGGNGPITVVCINGAKCCGVFCLLYNLLQKKRYEDQIDIFHAAREIQTRRPEFIISQEQYRFCYHTVHEHMENENVYVN